MHISFNTISIGNSQPLRFGCCGDKKPSFQNTSAVKNQGKEIDYKKEYEKSQKELAHMQRKYDVVSNLFALYLNPKFK